MKTDFPAILRKNARELSREQIESMSWNDARNYYYANKRRWSEERPKDSRGTVCFTGFIATERDELIEIAAGKNLRVVNSVTTTLHYLVCGPNAGPSKLQKATDQGVAIMSEEDFRNF